MLNFYSKHARNRVAIVGEFQDGQLCLAAARCSNKDNFCKKTGRTIATGRFNAGKKICNIPVEEQSTKVFLAFAEKLANEINTNAKFKEQNYDIIG